VVNLGPILLVNVVTTVSLIPVAFAIDQGRLDDLELGPLLFDLVLQLGSLLLRLELYSSSKCGLNADDCIHSFTAVDKRPSNAISFRSGVEGHFHSE
jgi:hypothetical protein